MSKQLKRYLYDALEIIPPETKPGIAIGSFLTILIILNVFAVVVGTVKNFGLKYFSYFEAFEVFSIAIFTLEYLIRLWACTENPKYAHPFWGRVRYIFSPLALVDLFAILPFYLVVIFFPHASFLRILRLLRIARLFLIFKLFRYSSSLQMLGRVLQEKKGDLMATFFIGFIIVVIASTLMFLAENQVQPEKFANIPAAMWWAVVTLTTVGYGDVYPITVAGKLLGATVCMVGIGMIAVPASILSSGLVQEMNKRKNITGHLCPHCGKAF